VIYDDAVTVTVTQVYPTEDGPLWLSLRVITSLSLSLSSIITPAVCTACRYSSLNRVDSVSSPPVAVAAWPVTTVLLQVCRSVVQLLYKPYAELSVAV